MSWYIYFYTYITNFIIFSQLLRCQFLIGQNKIIKYEIVTNHNWKYMFCENVITLVVWMFKIYSTFWFVQYILFITSFFFFQSLVCAFKKYIYIYIYIYLYELAYIYILLYWHNKFHHIFTVIGVSISYKSK